MRLKLAGILGGLLGMGCSCAAAMAASGKLLSQIPANSRLVVYMASLNQSDRLIQEIARQMPNQANGAVNVTAPSVTQLLAPMGLANAVDPHGSLLVVVPGNTIGVALNNVPSIFILPILHQKTFRQDTGAKAVGHGFYRAAIQNFDLGMPHTEKFVFRFLGHHAICAPTIGAIKSFQSAQRHLKPTQVTGTMPSGSPVIALRLNMKQEAFEIKAGITAMIGFQAQMQMLNQKPHVSNRTRQWQHFATAIINQTQTLSFMLGHPHHAIWVRTHLTPVAGSALAQLCAAQHTTSIHQLNMFPLRGYLTAMVEAINWRAADDFAAPFFTSKAKPPHTGNAAKTGAVAAKPWKLPWLLRHSTSAMWVQTDHGKTKAGHGIHLLAHFDRRIHAKTLQSQIAGLCAFAPAGAAAGLKFGKVANGQVALQMAAAGNPHAHYVVGKLGSHTLLMTRKMDYKAMADRAGNKMLKSSRAYRRMIDDIGMYLPHHLVMAVIDSPHALSKGAPRPAAGSLSFPVHHRPLFFTVSRSADGLNTDYFSPLRFIRRGFDLFTNVLTAN